MVSIFVIPLDLSTEASECGWTTFARLHGAQDDWKQSRACDGVTRCRPGDDWGPAHAAAAAGERTAGPPVARGGGARHLLAGQPAGAGAPGGLASGLGFFMTGLAAAPDAWQQYPLHLSACCSGLLSLLFRSAARQESCLICFAWAAPWPVRLSEGLHHGSVSCC